MASVCFASRAQAIDECELTKRVSGERFGMAYATFYMLPCAAAAVYSSLEATLRALLAPRFNK